MRRVHVTVLLAVSAVCFLPSSAVAQVNVKNPYSGSVCFSLKEDDNVTPITVPVQVIVTVDGVDKPPVPLPAGTTSASCPAGSLLYKVTGYTSSKGPTHTATAKFSTTDGVSLPTNPFDFVVKGGPPAAGTNFKIEQ